MTAAWNTRRPRLVMAAVSLLLVEACGSSLSPAGQLQNDTATVVEQANLKDVGGLRSAAAAMRRDISTQLGSGKITSAKAAALVKLLDKIEVDADLLKPVAPASPTPTDPPTSSPSPSASPTPSPTPTPTPTPSPTRSATPSPTPPPPTIAPTVDPPATPPGKVKPTKPSKTQKP